MSARCIISTAPIGKVRGDDAAHALCLARHLELVDAVAGMPVVPTTGDAPAATAASALCSATDGRVKSTRACGRVFFRKREVVARPDAADVVDSGLGLESRGKDRADLAAVSTDRDRDGSASATRRRA